MLTAPWSVGRSTAASLVARPRTVRATSSATAVTLTWAPPPCQRTTRIVQPSPAARPASRSGSAARRSTVAPGGSSEAPGRTSPRRSRRPPGRPRRRHLLRPLDRREPRRRAGARPPARPRAPSGHPPGGQRPEVPRRPALLLTRGYRDAPASRLPRPHAPRLRLGGPDIKHSPPHNHIVLHRTH